MYKLQNKKGPSTEPWEDSAQYLNRGTKRITNSNPKLTISEKEVYPAKKAPPYSIVI